MIVNDNIDSITGISDSTICKEFYNSTQEFINELINDNKVPVRVITAVQIGVGTDVITCTSAESAAMAYATRSTEIWALNKDFVSFSKKNQRMYKLYTKTLPVFKKYFVSK